MADLSTVRKSWKKSLNQEMTEEELQEFLELIKDLN